MTKGIGWPIGVAVILCATVAGNIGVILVTRDDPSFAVEPDYYRKAVEWDSSQAVAARSDQLAWTVDASASPLSDGRRQLALVLHDAGDAAVSGATVSGSLLHVARASDAHEVRFTEAASVGEGGWYVAQVPMARAGLWELRLVADRTVDGRLERFVHTLRIDTELARDHGTR